MAVSAPLPREIIEAIQAADVRKTSEQVARELTERFQRHVGATSVKKYRARARQQRREATADIVAQHAVEAVSGALDDLTWLRKQARERIERSLEGGGCLHPPHAQVLLQAIALELRHGTGVDPRRPLAGKTDEELEEMIEDVRLARETRAGGGSSAGAGPTET